MKENESEENIIIEFKCSNSLVVLIIEFVYSNDIMLGTTWSSKYLLYFESTNFITDRRSVGLLILYWEFLKGLKEQQIRNWVILKLQLIWSSDYCRVLLGILQTNLLRLLKNLLELASIIRKCSWSLFNSLLHSDQQVEQVHSESKIIDVYRSMLRHNEREAMQRLHIDRCLQLFVFRNPLV